MLLGHESISIYTKVAMPSLRKVISSLEGGGPKMVSSYDNLIKLLIANPSKLTDLLNKIDEPCWDRTSDLLIKSQLLYQLS